MSDLDALKHAKSLRDLAPILGFTPSGLSHTLYKAPKTARYHTFEIPKADGSTRVIDAPIGAQKLAQTNLAQLLQACRSEIDAKTGRRPLSHGFRPGQSIITNARLHTGRRYVLNLDLENFFPTFNFGRVRGFFIKDEYFKLTPAVATVIAQIACWENALPQGGPSSPIISDLIAHILDARLVRLAKEHKLTFSRYADDITFSTNQKAFPAAIAFEDAAAPGSWALGEELVRAVESRGFKIKLSKTRMQVRTSRQTVTGLTVNRKVNVSQAYYSAVRAMCHALFDGGAYHRPVAASGAPPLPITSLAPLEGMLAHVHFVKRSSDFDPETGKLRRDAPSGVRRLYGRFLFYKWFLALDRPVVLCEGATDVGYLRLALRNGLSVPPKLGEKTSSGFVSRVRFFNYSSKAHKFLDVPGGTDHLSRFIKAYGNLIDRYRHRPMTFPVIVVIDNDSGATSIFGVTKKLTTPPPSHTSTQPFYHLGHNLYLVKTPESSTAGLSCIEDLFSTGLKATKVDGKKFNGSNKVDYDTEYDKNTFIEKVVSPAAGSLDWTAFMPLLDRIAAAILHYETLTAATSLAVSPKTAVS